MDSMSGDLGRHFALQCVVLCASLCAHIPTVWRIISLC